MLWLYSETKAYLRKVETQRHPECHPTGTLSADPCAVAITTEQNSLPALFLPVASVPESWLFCGMLILLGQVWAKLAVVEWPAGELGRGRHAAGQGMCLAFVCLDGWLG